MERDISLRNKAAWAWS